jgi:UPF0755 protein
MSILQKIDKSFILKKILPSLFALFILLIISLFVTDKFLGSKVSDGSIKYDLLISSGDSSSKISSLLQENGMIRSKKYLNFLLKFSGNSTKLKQGLYQIDNGMSTRKIMEIILEGKVKLIQYTIPEGYNNRQIADVLLQKKLITNKDDFFKLNSDSKFLEKFKIPAKTTEGYLFPETYSVPYNYSIEKISEMMIKTFFSNLEKIPESKNLSPEDLHKKVILASIVEREAKIKSEQPLMAGVFVKRLSKNIALESCATVQYLFEKPKKRLFEKDLETKSDYNTYLHKGFPPGPISSPGMPALKAAFNPVETESLFFLRKPDGSHYFSKNHKEHLEAKKKYIDVLYD